MIEIDFLMYKVLNNMTHIISFDGVNQLSSAILLVDALINLIRYIFQKNNNEI